MIFVIRIDHFFTDFHSVESKVLQFSQNFCNGALKIFSECIAQPDFRSKIDIYHNQIIIIFVSCKRKLFKNVS